MIGKFGVAVAISSHTAPHQMPLVSSNITDWVVMRSFACFSDQTMSATIFLTNVSAGS